MTLGLFSAGSIPAAAATVAEAFIADNIQKGLLILNDRQLTEAQRADQFQRLLLSLTNTRRIAIFTLGQYARTAPQADLEVFVAAFQD